MLNDSIPVIGVNDDIVDDDKKPTSLMVMYFHTIVKSLMLKIDDAPSDGKLYGRKDGSWVEII